MPVAEMWDDGKIAFDCPGCGMSHAVNTDPDVPGPRWSWNSSFDKPTFSPSILVRWDFGPDHTPKVCHSFVREGMIEFLGDCTHTLAGQTIPLPEIS